MKYTPHFRPVEGAQTAALFIHGIVGTPAHFRDLVPLIPEDWSVYNILLDGHGGEVEDFARTSMGKWKAQVCAQVDEILQTHRQVLIVAHSMGTLFAIDQAIKHPDKVKALFLLAVPLVPRVLPSAAVNGLKAALGLAKEGTPAMDMLNDCGVRLSPRLWKYLAWIPRFWELLKEVRYTKRQLPQLRVPCLAFQSARDELVSPRACTLLKAYSHIRVTVLPDSGHFCYREADLQALRTALEATVRYTP